MGRMKMRDKAIGDRNSALYELSMIIICLAFNARHIICL